MLTPMPVGRLIGFNLDPHLIGTQYLLSEPDPFSVPGPLSVRFARGI